MSLLAAADVMPGDVVYINGRVVGVRSAVLSAPDLVKLALWGLEEDVTAQPGDFVRVVEGPRLALPVAAQLWRIGVTRDGRTRDDRRFVGVGCQLWRYAIPALGVTGELLLAPPGLNGPRHRVRHARAVAELRGRYPKLRLYVEVQGPTDGRPHPGEPALGPGRVALLSKFGVVPGRPPKFDARGKRICRPRQKNDDGA